MHAPLRFFRLYACALFGLKSTSGFRSACNKCAHLRRQSARASALPPQLLSRFPQRSTHKPVHLDCAWRCQVYVADWSTASAPSTKLQHDADWGCRAAMWVLQETTCTSIYKNAAPCAQGSLAEWSEAVIASARPHGCRFAPAWLSPMHSPSDPTRLHLVPQGGSR